MRYLSVIGILCAAISTSLSADVTITATTSGKSFGISAAGESVQYLKGTKMRADSTARGDMTSSIFDVGAQKYIIVNHKKKEAEVYDMAQLTADLQKVSDADIAVEMKPTGQSRTILGRACDEYNLRIAVGFSPGGDQNMKMNVVLSGPTWIAKDSPGAADFATFYKAAAEKGFIFTDPRAAKAQPGQAKGMAAMYKAMADAGVPYGSEIQIKFEGQGMMAGLMNKMGGGGFSNTVTAISTDPIPDDKFTIPAGYKVKSK